MATPGARHRQTGLEVRSGLLRFRIVGLDATEYVIPCLFLGDPNVAPHPSSGTALPLPLLQPFALLTQFRFVMDHDLASAAIYGYVIVEKK
jgi:hypothetical protein